MKSWSGARKKLEQDYLAPSLRGHIQYYVTSYHFSPDYSGAAAIRLNGRELLRGSYWSQWLKADEFSAGPGHSERWVLVYDAPNEMSLELGAFDQYTFYDAFYVFDDQSIEASLASKALLVRIFAVLDRRVGKRRLVAMRQSIGKEPLLFRRFYAIRAAAEGLDAPERSDEA